MIVVRTVREVNPDGISVRQWQEKYRAGAFEGKDTATQQAAGWWDWRCRYDALAGRLKLIAPVVMAMLSTITNRPV